MSKVAARQARIRGDRPRLAAGRAMLVMAGRRGAGADSRGSTVRLRAGAGKALAASYPAMVRLRPAALAA